MRIQAKSQHILGPLALAGALLLAGCAIGGLAADDPLELAPGEGLVGLQFDNLDKITQIQFSPVDKGSTINLAEAEAGITTHLFKARAGRYCLYMFHFGNWRIRFDEDGRSNPDALCFVVEAGKLGFGGRFSPRVVRGKVQMQQSFSSEEHFIRAVKAKYAAAARYFD